MGDEENSKVSLLFDSFWMAEERVPWQCCFFLSVIFYFHPYSRRSGSHGVHYVDHQMRTFFAIPRTGTLWVSLYPSGIFIIFFESAVGERFDYLCSFWSPRIVGMMLICSRMKTWKDSCVLFDQLKSFSNTLLVFRASVSLSQELENTLGLPDWKWSRSHSFF